MSYTQLASTLATPLTRLRAEPAASRAASLQDIAQEAYIWGVPLVLQATYLQRARVPEIPDESLHRLHAVSQPR